jgi:aminoglycoside 3-N-acetyltransferase
MNGRPEVARADVARGFADLGLPGGSSVLVHSSLSSLGWVDGGAPAVIAGIRDVLGPEGTLLAPTLTGHRDLSADNPPHIDLRSTPCRTGRIAETLRLTEGAVRSLHPTHSCAALGAKAAELTHRHEWSPTPCGLTSPYMRNAAAGGWIAIIGRGLEVCTTFHAVEELANVEYHLQPEIAPAACINLDGKKVETPVRLHSYEGPPRDFPVMAPLLESAGALRKHRIGAAQVLLIDAHALVEMSLERLRHDRWFLTVERGKRS